MDLLKELEDTEAKAARLRQLIKSGDCAKYGCDWKHIGGCNAGCDLDKDCGCSVPVYQCTKCGDCDYGDNEEADAKRASCNHGENPNVQFYY